MQVELNKTYTSQNLYASTMDLPSRLALLETSDLVSRIGDNLILLWFPSLLIVLLYHQRLVITVSESENSQAIVIVSFTIDYLLALHLESGSDTLRTALGWVFPLVHIISISRCDDSWSSDCHFIFASSSCSSMYSKCIKTWARPFRKGSLHTMIAY